jgi:hypothetical protein
MNTSFAGTTPKAFHSSDTTVQPLTREVLRKAKIAHSCRRVPLEAFATVVSGAIAPRVGNLVLARVEQTGQHKAIEGSDGRRTNLFPGDLIIVCYGNRYAPNQFEAEVPEDLGRCALVAAGGVAARVLSKHASMNNPTTIVPLGLVGDHDGAPLELLDWTLPAVPHPVHRPYVIAVVGTSMDAGKTTSAANLIRGFHQAGITVGAAKITGTGSPKDTGLMLDAGAHPVFDFTDTGHPSTYFLSESDLSAVLLKLTGHLAHAGVAVSVLEIADGLYQRETEMLCRSRTFAETVDGILFAAGDAMGAKCGTDWLLEQNLPLVGITGLLTASPLAMRETRLATRLPVFDLAALKSGTVGESLGLQTQIRKRA